MLMRLALFFFLGIGILGVAGISWMLLVGAAGGPAVASSSIRVLMLVASRPLQGGSLMKAEDLLSQEVALADVPVGASLDTPVGRAGLTGAMIRRSLGKGQTILPVDVIHPGDHSFLAAVLSPSMRGVTVGVDAVSGTAGLIWPGDRVDVILTQALDDPAAGRRIAAETILSDARVIAVDQQIVEGQAPDGTVPPANRTATLEVTAAQVERVLVAGRLGKLSLSVLSADRRADPLSATSTAPAPLSNISAGIPTTRVAHARDVIVSDQAAKSSITWAGDVSPALGSGGAQSAPVIVHVFPGGSDSKEYHF